MRPDYDVNCSSALSALWHEGCISTIMTADVLWRAVPLVWGPCAPRQHHACGWRQTPVCAWYDWPPSRWSAASFWSSPAALHLARAPEQDMRVAIQTHKHKFTILESSSNSEPCCSGLSMWSRKFNPWCSCEQSWSHFSSPSNSFLTLSTRVGN